MSSGSGQTPERTHEARAKAIADLLESTGPAARSDVHEGRGHNYVCERVTLLNRKGLHARAAAKFVKIANAYDCLVRVSRDGSTVDACSIMGLLLLAAPMGAELELCASGSQASEAIAALLELVGCKFDEE